MIRAACFWLAACLVCHADVQDPGRREIGKVEVRVFYATNDDPAAAGATAKPADDALAEKFRSEEKLRFTHYRVLGSDTQPLLQSYENWAQPLKPSREILVRFEAQGHPTATSAVVNLELWLSRKKIFKSVAKLEGAKPLLILGPEWRGGRLLISVALAGGSDRIVQ